MTKLENLKFFQEQTQLQPKGGYNFVKIRSEDFLLLMEIADAAKARFSVWTKLTFDDLKNALDKLEEEA